ncbi:gluconokinase [Porifericola rhodea]|uniref:gluconokinase n=1 Tax=Porifericola rhodea TaxID=930972 RepID=UPI002666BD4A|nr:gluconokinase [Porifericola rhodea]WKN32331.1 gluconokinase [Porifericola rhodea]
MADTDQDNIIIGLDVGTTGVKVLAANARAEVLAVAEATYELHQPQAGYREQDPESLLQITEDTLKKVLDNIDGTVRAISFGAAMHSLIAIDKNGRPLTPAIIWADVRSASAAAKLRQTEEGRQIYAASGAPIHAMLPLCKVAWLRDHQNNIFKQAYKFISLKEYMIARWCGKYVVDYAIAGASGFWNKNTKSWNTVALQWTGIGEHQLSELKPPTYNIGMPVFSSFRHKNITEHTSFIIGASDGCLANLNASGFDEDVATMSLGTSGAIRLTARETSADPAASIFDYHLTESYHVIGGPTNNGGIVLEWLKQQFFPELEDAALILQKVKEIPAGAEGLSCLPYFFGERAPLWREDVSGQFFGVQSHHSRAHFARAAIEGVVFNLYGIAEVLQKVAKRELQGLWTDGGLTRSSFISQLIADVFCMPVYHAESSHGVARGAVLLATHALNLADLEANRIEKKETFMPDAQVSNQLKEAYYKFVKLRNAYQQALP